MRQRNAVMGTQYRAAEKSGDRASARRPSRNREAGQSQNAHQRRGKKKFSVRKRILLIVFAAVAITVILLLSPIFSISKIRISAVSLYSSEELLSSFDGLKGKNGFLSLLQSTSFSDLDDLFRLRFGSKEESLLFDYPLIKNIVVRYDLPDTVVVEIEERTPVMVTESDGMYLHIDSEGYLLGTYTQADQLDMPVIRGIRISDYKIGTSVAGGKDRATDDAIKICSTMKQLSMLSYIDIIDVSDYNEIWMYCAPSLSIKFGSADDIGRKLSYIKGIIDSGYDGNSNGTLDLSAGGNPVFKNNESAQEAPETPQAPETAQ